ncbi:MAG TPA: alpha/beta hydrolase [Stellaceae bacterium]|nr:alpha/beta hydrolase [Stellaceae bacterium]
MTDLSRLVEAPAVSLPYIDSAFPDRPLVLHAARPRDCHTGTPVLFVHHGVGRNGKDYRDYWLDLVDEAGVLAISVEFPEASFPEHLWYQFGNLHDKNGTPNRREDWTFGIDERLFDRLRAQGVTTRQRYGLFGHSAGGQFVHRMISFGFRDRVAVAVSANAGTYAMPDLATPWPFGLGQTDVDAEALRAWLGFRLTVMAGTADVVTTGRFFPKGPRSMRQGATRYERAHNYVRCGHAAAAALRTPCAWTVIDVPGVGHDGKRMSAAAAPIVSAALQTSP